jgi:hypothetical protein
MDSSGKHVQSSAVWQSAPVNGFFHACLLSLLACLTLLITACGGGTSSPAQSKTPVSGNWQFTLALPGDNSFEGDPTGAVPKSVLQGGFLVQKSGAVSGQALFSIWLPPTGGGVPTECNSGTATIAGTISGQAVNLTATVGTLDQNGNPATQTFTLSNGQLSSDSSAIQGGTYTSTSGYYIPRSSSSPAACGTAQTASNISWSAASVPSLTGAFQGFFHSTTADNGFLNGQVFSVSGSLLQGANTGASSATVTGSIAFTGYPCLSRAAVNGQISGKSVVLQIFNGSNGSSVGQIGGVGNDAGGTYTVAFTSTPNGYVLQNPGASTAYVLATGSCPLPAGGTLGVALNGDAGDICLAFGTGNNGTAGSTACTEPITVSPASLTFPAQPLGSASRTRQVITITNIQPAGSAPLNLGPTLKETDSTLFYANGGDFDGLPNFSEQDTCGTSLAPQQSCTVTISFAPQQSCPWLPYGSVPNGLAPAKCPAPFDPNVTPKSLLSTLLTVNIPAGSTPDGDSTFSIPIKGAGMSAIASSTPELDFGAVAVGELSLSQQLAQTLTFTNQSVNPVQILGALTGAALTSFQQTCNDNVFYYLPRPPQNGAVPGLLVAATNGGNNNITPAQYPPSGGSPTAQYFCDFDTATGLSSFQIMADSCSGATLGPSGSPSDSCSVTIVFAPQPESYINFPDPGTNSGLDYFLELNTAWCGDATNPPQPNCEVDSGRFPVELTANPQGPLRMSPAAGLNFGTVLKGATAGPLTITLTNDQSDSLTVNFTGKALTGTDYLESDDCPTTLDSGKSCTLTFTFTPSVSGYDSGSLTIGYSSTNSSGKTTYSLTQYVYLRGIGQ